MDDSRIIPARAGSSEFVSSAMTMPPDHPRACGEQGLGDGVLYGYLGIIPARAGSRRAVPRPWASMGDHPRACGEQLKPLIISSLMRGSSPRVRGAAATARHA